MRQDKSLGYIGSVRIGGGFSGDTPQPQDFYPKDRLSKFLNFKSKKEEDIYKFCSDYQILFNPISFIRTFLREQRKLQNIARKLTSKEFSEEDLELINKRLGRIKTQVKSVGEISNASRRIAKVYNENQLIVVKSDNTVDGLWEELVKRFIEKQDIKECANCGDFFVLKSKHYRIYCDKPQCGNTHNTRKRRANKKTQG